jgi:cytochrome c oxidase cbb3-type subunit III
MANKETDELSGIDTTGHEWDGIRELNNPMPRWWVITFYITIVWAIAYTVAYPAWPLISGTTKGWLGYSSRAEVGKDIAAATAAQSKYVDAIKAADLPTILANEELRTFANAGGAAAFKVNCSPCHGSGAAGGHGYPNLNDDDWLWGGDIASIHTTLVHGVRYAGDADTRVSQMPAFGDILKPEEIDQVANFVVSLSGGEADTTKATAGKALFAANCEACHGKEAKGNHEFGAPNLTDAIWFYGSGLQAVTAQITKPKQGVMPAWGARLGETTVKELAVYVHSLGGGQ